MLEHKYCTHIDDENTYFEEYIYKDNSPTEYKLSVMDSEKFTECWSKYIMNK